MAGIATQPEQHWTVWEHQQAQASLHLSQGGVHGGTGSGTAAVLWIQRCQGIWSRDRCEDWEKVEGSRRSPASGNATEAQGHPRNSGARQSWTREFYSNPVRLCQPGRERQKFVQDEVQASVEEERTSRAVAMRQQGAWMRWEQAMERSVTWKEIWQWDPKRIKFLIQGVYDVLPSPSNLFRWGKVETPACPLCSKAGTLEHILNSCSKALAEGWYRWRHDQVLKSIAEEISKGIKGSRYNQARAKAVRFVKEEQRPEKPS